jgi:predicted transcriptional regulator
MEDESLFIRLLGGSPIIKILDFLLADRDFDYSKKGIAENANVSYNTLNSVWPYLLQNGILTKTRRIGKQDMFKLNTKNEFVKELIKFFDSLLRRSIEEAGASVKVIQATV